MSGLNFNQSKTNSAMTHAMVLSAKVRTNERLWHTLDIGNMCGQLLALLFFQFKEQND